MGQGLQGQGSVRSGGRQGRRNTPTGGARPAAAQQAPHVKKALERFVGEHCPQGVERIPDDNHYRQWCLAQPAAEATADAFDAFRQERAKGHAIKAVRFFNKHARPPRSDGQYEKYLAFIAVGNMYALTEDALEHVLYVVMFPTTSIEVRCDCGGKRPGIAVKYCQRCGGRGVIPTYGGVDPSTGRPMSGGTATCPTCHGRAATATPLTCPKCGGRGTYIAEVPRTIDMQRVILRTD